MTRPQLQALLAVAQHHLERGGAPTNAELAQRMGLGLSTAMYYVAMLRALGWLEQGGGASRTLRLRRCAACGALLGRCEGCGGLQAATCGDRECLEAVLDAAVPGPQKRGRAC